MQLCSRFPRHFERTASPQWLSATAECLQSLFVPAGTMPAACSSSHGPNAQTSQPVEQRALCGTRSAGRIISPKNSNHSHRLFPRGCLPTDQNASFSFAPTPCSVPPLPASRASSANNSELRPQRLFPWALPLPRVKVPRCDPDMSEFGRFCCFRCREGSGRHGRRCLQPVPLDEVSPGIYALEVADC